MCGIAGYFGAQEIIPSRIQSCLALMHHRGPDHSAFRQWTNDAGNHVCLLHSRLSIIDLDQRANQPFAIGSRWMTYNGELYNYPELRLDLISKEREFITTSDTEVLLTAIDHYGWSVLDRFEGMWAFAVYDQLDGSLSLCRDRFGEKPLYLYRDASGLYFGSETKFIVALLGRRLDIDFDHLYRYLVNGYKALYKKGGTFFKGLIELPQATILHLDADGHEVRNVYWQPCFCPDETMSYAAAVTGVRERLMRAVELRLRSDVPLAFCMSGGVDSNTLISIARKVFDYDVHGFTILGDDVRYDEQDIITRCVAELGILHDSVRAKKEEFLAKLRALVRHHDAPVYTISYYAHWLLQQSISDHGYRVSISGTAADELFTGYYDHHLAYLYEIRGDPELYATSLQAWKEHIQPLVRNPHLRNPNVFIENPGFRSHIFLNADGFAQYLAVDWFESFSEQKYTSSLLRNRMLNEMFRESVPVILHEDDLNAMYFSIENRSPFLDRELFEFCYRIPTRYLIRDGFSKAVLRDSMRGIVPTHVLDNRRKVGFNVPIRSFVDVHDPDVRAMLLDNSLIFDYVQRDKIENLVDKEWLPNSESKFLFSFINSKLFLEEFAT